MCNCIAKFNADHAADNLRLPVTVNLNAGLTIVQIRAAAVDPEKWSGPFLPVVWAAFCPFCGKRYVAETAAVAA